MTPEEITEGNKLIADFMNLEIINVVWGNGEKQGQSFNAWRHPEVSSWIEFGKEHWLKYHILWDWLMPVVEKIEQHCGCIVEIWLSLGRGCRICKSTTKENKPKDFISESNSTIEAVWLVVIEYIKYYNQNKLA